MKTTTQPKFNASKFESLLIARITERAQGELGLNRLQVAMDIEACHSNGCPLKLDELLSASPFDFRHDIYGIQRHIDRSTGQLEGIFSPRFCA